jgi:hypothetical protein
MVNLLLILIVGVLCVDVVSDPTDPHQLIPQIENLQNNGFDLTHTKMIKNNSSKGNGRKKCMNKEGEEIYKKRTTVERTVANIKKGFNYMYNNYAGK